MFTRGSNGFSGMLERARRGQPGLDARTDHLERVDRLPPTDPDQRALRPRPVPHRLRDRVEADLRPPWRSPSSGRSASGGSGRRRWNLPRGATPFGGGPGGVLFYAVLAVLLWPSEGSDQPFVAARTVGVTCGQGHLGGRCGASWPCWRWSARVARPRRFTISWPGSTTDSRDGWPTSTGPRRRCSSITARRRRSCSPWSASSWRSGSSSLRRSPRSPGAGHRRLCAHLGGRPELRRHPGRRGHRSELRAPGHPPGPASTGH